MTLVDGLASVVMFLKLLSINRGNKMKQLSRHYIFCLILPCLVISENHARRLRLRTFPKNFIFGVSTSAYQMEGAWNISDKGPSIWDHCAHTRPDKFYNGANHDTSADSYHHYKRDVEMLRELGVDFYHFSMAWSRVLPKGFSNYVSQDGLAYYNRLIDELVKYNIRPVVTIYHFDLPQVLQDLGGWVNPTISSWIQEYARVLFREFGDRVGDWLTINEPHEMCLFSYETGIFAPFIDSSGIGNYMCTVNVLKAHAGIYHLYNDEFRASQKGRIGIPFNVIWPVPYSDNEMDIQGAMDYLDFTFGLYANPIYGQGDIPKSVKNRVAALSAKQGFSTSRLPKLTPDEVEGIKGTFDFMGVNYYTAVLIVRKGVDIDMSPSWENDLNVETYFDHSWKGQAIPHFAVVPKAMREVLNYVKERYNNPEILIMENGFSTSGKTRHDDERVSYIREHLEEVLKAILDDGVNVTGYAPWSLMDGFEHNLAYKYAFGLYHVDFDDPERRRLVKKSGVVYKEIVRSRVIDPKYDPKSLRISIENEYD